MKQYLAQSMRRFEHGTSTHFSDSEYRHKQLQTHKEKFHYLNDKPGSSVGIGICGMLEVVRPFARMSPVPQSLTFG